MFADNKLLQNSKMHVKSNHKIPIFSLHKNPSTRTKYTRTHQKTKGDFYIMKATGIVRRIDDLGRVVIPKEIRRTMRIRVGDPVADNIDIRRPVMMNL